MDKTEGSPGVGPVGAPAATSEPAGYHPAAKIAYIEGPEHEMVPVFRSEVREFANEVLRVVRNPVEGLSAWATVCLGIVIAAGLSLITLYGTEGKNNHPATWVLSAHWVAVIAFGGIGFFCWRADRALRAERASGAEALSKRIKALDTRAPVKSPKGEPPQRDA